MKGNNDPQQAFSEAIKQIAIDWAALIKDVNERIAMAHTIPTEMFGVPSSKLAARIHKDYTAKTTRMLFCIYCNRPIDACTCADAIEAEYTDVTPTNFPQLPAPKDRRDE